jgi:hypothetical protein
MAEFEYEPHEGFYLSFGMALSGYDDELDGDLEPRKTMVEVEETMEGFGEEYAEETGASVVRVRGDHGWREYTWSNGAAHRYDWTHHLMDLRCVKCQSPRCDLFMVRDGVWEASGIDGWVCFRCLEEALDRQLTPADFDPGVPANTDVVSHEPELRSRMGLP